MTTEALQMIPVSRLVQAPENVRKTNTGAGIEELKASILAEGLLQNLIAYPTDKEKFAVVGGERRRKALAALIKEKKLAKAHAVPCLVRDREEAIALSQWQLNNPTAFFFEKMLNVHSANYLAWSQHLSDFLQNVDFSAAVQFSKLASALLRYRRETPARPDDGFMNLQMFPGVG
ncbi:MAG: hypothetical protein B7Z81_03905 [Acidocella sp. 20-61-6]|nr:MAG: hypothetical protein B7Z81_03905 [Acidocella sp. 20-61-6]